MEWSWPDGGICLLFCLCVSDRNVRWSLKWKLSVERTRTRRSTNSEFTNSDLVMYWYILYYYTVSTKDYTLTSEYFCCRLSALIFSVAESFYKVFSLIWYLCLILSVCFCRSAVRLTIRKIQFSPDDSKVFPVAETTFEFLMSEKPLHVKLSLPKEVRQNPGQNDLSHIIFLCTYLFACTIKM